MPYPSKLTPEVQARIVQVVSAGNYRETAARYVGIDPRTFHRWMERGEKAAAEAARLEELTRAQLVKEARERGRKVRPKVSAAELRSSLLGAEAAYLEFRVAVDGALAEAQIRDVAIIEKAAKTQWQAGAWRLERMFPDLFGQRQRRELTGSGGGPIEVRLAHVSDDQLAAAIRQLEGTEQHEG